MNIGNRIYYNQHGNILFQAGEIENGTPRSTDEVINYIDLEYGIVDYSKYLIVKIDVETGKPILEQFKFETDEQIRIRELEDELLLNAEKEIGGIL